MDKLGIGPEGEEIASLFLKNKGWKILGRNVKYSGVEADIVAKDGKTIVIVEVKTKYSADYGAPQEMVGPNKQRQLKRFAHSWLSKYGECAIRIDVIAVKINRGEPEIEHIINAVEE